VLDRRGPEPGTGPVRTLASSIESHHKLEVFDTDSRVLCTIVLRHDDVVKPVIFIWSSGHGQEAAKWPHITSSRLDCASPYHNIQGSSSGLGSVGLLENMYKSLNMKIQSLLQFM